MEVFDVIVIGGGPAGGSAALHCAQAGLKTMLVEEHVQAGDPVHCGECLSLLAIQRMNWLLPDEVVSERVKGIRVIFPGGKSALVTEPGFVLEKHRFEQWIVRQAQKDGAKIVFGERIASAEREGGVWKLKSVNGVIFFCKLLIDATGVQSFSSNVLKINQRFESVIGMQYEMQNIPRDGYIDFYIWPKLAPHGYLWMIPKSGGRANVGLVTNENNKAKPYCDEFVKKMGWEKHVVNKTFGGLIPASGPLEKTFDDALILVGDAAGFTSPLFEGGTQLSLMSGKFASIVAAKAVAKNDFSKDVLKEYESLWKAEFPNYKELMGGKNSLYELTDEEMDEMASLFPQELGDLGPAGQAKIGLQLLAGHRKLLLQKNIVSVFKAFKYSRAQYYGW